MKCFATSCLLLTAVLAKIKRRRELANISTRDIASGSRLGHSSYATTYATCINIIDIILPLLLLLNIIKNIDTFTLLYITLFFYYSIVLLSLSYVFLVGVTVILSLSILPLLPQLTFVTAIKKNFIFIHNRSYYGNKFFFEHLIKENKCVNRTYRLLL